MRSARLIDYAHRAVLTARPRTRAQLHAWVRIALSFDVPRAPLNDGHAAPFDYLARSFFGDDASSTGRDLLVWAARGSGKTQLGAIGTLLDLIFKPGIQIRILGGSFEQSARMHRYLRRMFESPALALLIDGRITGKALELTNGSRVEVLSQSQQAVRGLRVHKLRCDEVEIFEPEIWDAAQLTTRSGWCGSRFVRGTIEALSTMHEPFGLMARLVRDADAARRDVMRWNVIDVLERCPPRRSCDSCALFSSCGGRARRGRGFVRIDDAVAQKSRVGADVWRAEMLCQRPSKSSLVYPMFDPEIGGRHVAVFDHPSDELAVRWLGGVDFGYRAPTVLLITFLDQEDVLHVVDEIAERECVVEAFIRQVQSRRWPMTRWIGADPAGHQRSDQTGLSTIALWRRAGFVMRTRMLRIEHGINAVKARLQRADGRALLRIHARCRRLIEALSTYHYPRDNPHSTNPVKDGPDHAVDALRYLIVNLDGARGELRTSPY